MSENNSIRCFAGGKSKAIRGLKKFGEHAVAASDKLLFQHGETGQWCFDADDAAEAQRKGAPESTEDPAPKPEEGKDENVGGTVAPSDGDQRPSDDLDPAASNAFGHMNGVLSNVPHLPEPVVNNKAQSRSSYTIEKNRPEQHGIKRPSAGGLCRAVWDAMDELRASQAGAVPTSEQVRALADSKGWNKNNAMIEFYQWRKFNGIVGRTPKANETPPAGE